jgi:putative spermidine/putrescine transport system permease protein
MTEATAAPRPARGGLWSRASQALWRRPWSQAAFLLTPPLAWFLVIYVAALVVMLITAFWTVNPFTGNLERIWNTANFTQILGNSGYRGIITRTVGMAAGVTLVDAAIALPFAYYMARVAAPRTRTVLFVCVLLPLWASYLAKVYAWLVIFTHDGVLNWSLARFGIGSQSMIYTNSAVFIVFCYIWLPYMIIPVYAAIERIPQSLIEASQDLGGRTARTAWSVIAPLALPGIVAGSIFTFSLTLGDYVTPTLIGGGNSELIGTVIASNIGVANNLPLAAAMAMVPIAIMACYLVAARALGAFREL